MSFELLIFFILIVFLFVIGVFGFIDNVYRKSKYSHINLALGIHVGNLVEKYIKIYSKVNLKIGVLPYPSNVLGLGYIKLNKKKLYDFDLYSTGLTVFNLMLCSKKYIFLFYYSKIQFFLMCLILVLCILLNWYAFLVYVINFFIAFCIVFAIFASFRLRALCVEAKFVAIDLLDVKESEKRLIGNFFDEFSGFVFSYPIDFLVTVIRFFVPIKSTQ